MRFVIPVNYISTEKMQGTYRSISDYSEDVCKDQKNSTVLYQLIILLPENS